MGLMHKTGSGRELGKWPSGWLPRVPPQYEVDLRSSGSGSRITQIAGVIAQRIREEVFRSPDFQEGIQAFREKRPPRWPSI